MSRAPFIEPFLLANTPLLHLAEAEYHSFRRTLNGASLREAVYLGQHGLNHGLPDHVFSHRWEAFIQENQARDGHFVAPALFSLADQFLEIKAQRVAVKLDRFGDWQNLLSRMSGLPVQAALFARQSFANGPHADTPHNARQLRARIAAAIGESPLVSPHDAAVEDYIRHEGLHESHLHLNGTTMSEFCWQHALLDPRKATHDFDYAYNHGNDARKVQELCHAIDPKLTPQILYRRLQLARQLRNELLARALSTQTNSPQQDESLKAQHGMKVQRFSIEQFINTPHPFPARHWFDARHLPQSHQIEAWWLCLLLVKLNQKPNTVIDRMLQLYLLIQNQYLQLTVQRDDQFGFDQFQKFTFISMRWQPEQEYTARFWQMHGYRNQASDVATFEGRFAPKKTFAENLDLVSTILRGYAVYLRESNPDAEKTAPTKAVAGRENLKAILDHLEDKKHANRPHEMQLALVAHFIKEPWNHKKGGVRHAKLREKLRQNADGLCQLLRREPRLKRWIRGIDAAANELHAGPDAFAAIFRIMRSNGIEHATFHSGEDFVHLLGGIRYIADALLLLDLQPGDRLGHGTAVGLHPRRWLDSMPGKIAIRRGEWMIDMVMAWHFLRDNPATHIAAAKAASEATRCAGDVFQQFLPVEELAAMLKLRGLWPAYVLGAVDDPKNWRWQHQSLDANWRNEAKLVAQEQQVNRQSLQLLARWLRDPDVQQRCEAFIQVESAFLPEADILALQQEVQREIVNRQVIIETLPTSNVRISQYRHIREHHSLRWMGLGKHRVKGDCQPMVSLGSDDPGIFATDMRSEFYHLYAVLRKELGMTDVAALQALSCINERGRIYRFHSNS